MTFKHIDLKDSVIMKSLEFVAHQKGWILPKSEPITKIASGPDLSISSSFDENVLKLANALRSSNPDFVRYASNLEERLVLIKTSEMNKTSAKLHLYNTHNETGEDLIEEAHPKGDKQIVDSSDDLGFVETTVSRHKKIVDIVNKQPTGKLAYFNSIMGQIKIALGADGANLSLDESGDMDEGHIDIIKKYLSDLSSYIDATLNLPIVKNFPGMAGVEENVSARLADMKNDIGNILESKLELSSSEANVQIVDLLRKRLSDLMYSLDSYMKVPQFANYSRETKSGFEQLNGAIKVIAAKINAISVAINEGDTFGAKFQADQISSASIINPIKQLDMIAKRLLGELAANASPDVVKYKNAATLLESDVAKLEKFFSEPKHKDTFAFADPAFQTVLKSTKLFASAGDVEQFKEIIDGLGKQILDIEKSARG